MTDNKLIAEFMGWTPCDPNDSTMYANPQDESDVWSTDDMIFNASWDELMPVVEKLSSLCYEPCELDNMKHALLTGDIESVYDDVVEFIKEYNDEQ